MYIKLTSEQKIHYYKQALSTFRQETCGPYICNVLKFILRDDGFLDDVSDEEGWPDSDTLCERTFPEFYKQLLEYDKGPYPTIDNSELGNDLRELFLNNAIKILENENRIDG